MAGEEMEGNILGLDGVIDMFRGSALMLIFLSGRQEMTTDEEKTKLFKEHIEKGASYMSDDMFKAVSEEIYRQHSNYSTRLTDSPEDIKSRADKIILKAIEMYLEKAPK